MRAVLTATAFFLFAGSCFGQDVVFVGHPLVRTINDEGDAKTKKLDEKEAQEYLCLITRKGDRYFWASRDNTELRRHNVGAFEVFVATNGGGYVKIFKGVDIDGLPNTNRLGIVNYLEHFPALLVTFTYWGRSAVLKISE